MSTQPNEDDIRVWYIPQIPMEPYVVHVPNGSLGEAVRIREAIIGLSIFEFEHNVKPDYSDAAGIERYEIDGEGGFDWYEIDESELEES